MASPDATPYIDLLLQDVDAQDIVDLAVQQIQSRVPDWVPRETNVEMVLIEGLAVQIAELVYALNRVPSAVVQVLLKLNGIDYDQGAPPECDITFNLNTTDGVTIDANTSARLDLADGSSIVFTTTTDATAPAGASTLTVHVVGDQYTSTANGTPAGTELTLVDSLLYVDSVVTATPVDTGRDEESDDDYFTRGAQFFSRQTSTLVLPSQFVAAMLEESYVSTAYAVDNYDVTADPDGNGPVGNDPGHITITAYGEGVPLTSDEKTELLAKITGLTMVSLTVHWLEPVITTVNVSASIYIEDGYDSASVIANVTAALGEFLDPMTWGWKPTVRHNDLISVITNAEGVDFVNSITTPSGDLTLTGLYGLASLGTATITVLS